MPNNQNWTLSFKLKKVSLGQVVAKFIACDGFFYHFVITNDQFRFKIPKREIIFLSKGIATTDSAAVMQKLTHAYHLAVCDVLYKKRNRYEMNNTEKVENDPVEELNVEDLFCLKKPLKYLLVRKK